MKKRTSLHRSCAAAAVLAAAVLLAACDQAPLFHDISKEIEPKLPTVEGSPSRIIAFGGKEYTANGKLWVYNGNSWKKASGPSGTVRDLAVADGRLYALVVADDPADNKLYRTNDGSSWSKIDKHGSYEALQAIYGADDELFVAARKSGHETYAVLRVSGGALATVSNLTDMDEGGRLTAAVSFGGNYYLATSGEGIYVGNDVGALSKAGGTDDDSYLLNGLIATATEVVAVGRGGYVLAGTGTSFAERISGATYRFTGALAISGDILMLGGTAGYREIVLNGAGNIPASPELQSPGSDSPTTVKDSATYAAALGKRAVNHLHKSTQDGTLFASTQQAGLWSYRNNVWNAED